MTPSDELWIEMAEFDADMADGIWDGTPAPADSPSWYGDVATLIRVATSPARPDELAAEGEIVALMQGTITGMSPASAPATDVVAEAVDTGASTSAADTDTGTDPADTDTAVVRPLYLKGFGKRLNGSRPLHMKARDASGPDDEDDDEDEGGRGGRIVRRLLAVKAVAVTTAVAVGVTAAAAATGIVTVVVPAARDRLLTDDKNPSQVVDHDDSGDNSGSGSGSGGTVRGCASEDTACTTTDDGTIVIPGTGASGGSAGDPATDPSQDGSGATTNTTVGDGTTTGSDTTDTTSPSSGGPTDPPPTETTVTTSIPEVTTSTTETPPTTEPPIEPMSEENAQGAGGTAAESAGSAPVEALAAGATTTVSAG
jgi:hypothetical protein